MSDGTSTLTESAGTSTSEIAANVINEAEQTSVETSADTGSAPIDTTNTAEATSPEPKSQPTQAELSAAAEFLLKQGHKLKKEDGRDVWLPAKTVEGMLDRYVEHHRATWNGEKSTIESQAKTAREQVETIKALVAGDPRGFLSELATIDPRYAAFLEQKVAEARAVDTSEPKPDIDLGNGQWTYSQEQNDKRIEWKARQLLDERLKPWEEREKRAKEQAEQQKAMSALETRSKQQIEEAQTWPGWADHREDILKALQEDSAKAKAEGGRPKLSLEGAYRQVVMSKLLEDDGKRRERLLKEIQAAPKAPALSRQTTDAPRTPGVLSTHDIAAQTIAKLERGA